MNFHKYLINFGFLLFFGVGLSAMAAVTPQTAPDVLARTVTEEVLAAIRNDKEIVGGNSKKARELIEVAIAPHFNFSSMTQLAMGKHWAAASPDQRKALVAEFRALLIQTYTSSLVLFKDQKIEFRPLKMAPEDSDVLVRSVVKKTDGGEPVQVDYGMEKTDAGWKVYNVKVGGISLVESYRSTFNSEIGKNGIDGLVKMLKDKNRNFSMSQK